ncbi:DUF413 domain-containing protein [Thalassotalea sp. PLHSN55]|uniref:DUF413 domain-containing protein n=1 Tax=Thalassotalea sp. PLHSN55 TaxID=3435888 RepID=UPI003F8388E4
MNTTIRVGKKLFYGESDFPRGIGRSGFFNKKETELLEQYGDTLMRLADKALTPENEEESLFVAAIDSGDESANAMVKLWRKYVNAVEKTKRHHSFTQSNVKPVGSAPTDSQFDDLNE